MFQKMVSQAGSGERCVPAGGWHEMMVVMMSAGAACALAWSHVAHIKPRRSERTDRTHTRRTPFMPHTMNLM